MTFIETIPHACADKTLASKVVVFLLETFNGKTCQLLSSENVKIMNNLGRYIYNSLKLQNDLLP